MATIRMEILPGLSRTLTPGNRGAAIRDVTFQPGDTLGRLMSRLHAEGDPLGILWDAGTGHISPHVHTVINSRLLGSPQAQDTLLQAGDHIKWIPVYSGG